MGDYTRVNKMHKVARDADLETLFDSIDDVIDIVGDESDGLVHDVAALETTVGGSSAGLVKDVADLEAAVASISGAPTAGTATLDATKKIITIPMSVVIYSTTLMPIDIKSNITISTDGTTYSALAGADSLSIGGNKVQITLDTALSTATNTIKVAANTFMSVVGTQNAEFITNNMDATA